MAHCSERLGGERLVVSKGFLVNVLGCESRHLEPDSFTWSPATARGFVSHKAIELGAHWQGEPVPEMLVDEAIARLADDASQRGDFVAGLTDADRAELRSFAVDRVTRFLQDFPPMPGRAPSRCYEARTRWSPPGCVELVGKTDLVIGRPEGRDQHRLDRRLQDRLAQRAPPRRPSVLRPARDARATGAAAPAGHLLPRSAEADVEDVTEGVLEAALARLVGGIERHVELTVERRPPREDHGRAAVGGASRCPRCDEGRAHLAASTTTAARASTTPTDHVS